MHTVTTARIIAKHVVIALTLCIAGITSWHLTSDRTPAIEAAVAATPNA